MNVRTLHTRGVCAAHGWFLIFLLFAPAAAPLRAQTPDDAPIRELNARLDRGETEAVRQELPGLVAKYQNHPGILFVQARVATDGIEAAKLYQSVLDNFPASEWADDALYNLYQYYYAMGLYKTAELKMQQLRKEYPASAHLAGRAAPPGDAGGDARTAGTPPAARDTIAIAPPPAGDTGVRPAPPGQDARDREAGGQEAAGGEIRPGREPVTKEEANPGAPAGAGTAKGAPPVSAMPYALQTGAFSTSENARRQKEWLEDRGYTAEITNRVRGGRSLYLVWVGSFRTPDEARRVLAEIQSRYNITPIVVER